MGIPDNTLFQIIKKLLSENFTGQIVIHVSQGGVTKIRQQKDIPTKQRTDGK